LLNPDFLNAWIELNRIKREGANQDTNARRKYLNEDERYKETIDQQLKEKVTRLEPENSYLKNRFVLSPEP
jgi:hypothetical protein